MKLTKKQSEIIEKAQQIQNETNQTVYFMYNEASSKIHAVTITLKENNEIDKIENKGILCTHNVAMTMQNKGIVVPEIVGKYKKYQNEDTLYDFILCKINDQLAA